MDLNRNLHRKICEFYKRSPKKKLSPRLLRRTNEQCNGARRQVSNVIEVFQTKKRSLTLDMASQSQGLSSLPLEHDSLIL